MKSLHVTGAIGALVTAIAVIAPSASAADLAVRVDGDSGSAMPTGSGGGWGSDAFKYLGDAVIHANLEILNNPQVDDAEIWVAATDPGNPYEPDESAASPGGSGDVAASFMLLDEVALLGGFAGNETDRNDRDPLARPTVLWGDLLHNDDFAAPIGSGDWYDSRVDNATHVLLSEVQDESSQRTRTIDGFVVTRGGAMLGKPAPYPAFGAGVLVLDSSPRIVRCTLVENFALEAGGAAHVEVKDEQMHEPWFSNCTLTENVGETTAGAVCNRRGQTTFVNCLVQGNRAGNAAGILNAWEELLLPVSSLHLVNCTVTENSVLGSSQIGGGIVNAGVALVENCILWGNSDTSPVSSVAQAQLYENATLADETIARYCIIQDDAAGDGSTPIYDPGSVALLDLDPLFVDTGNDDFRLQSSSPGIDAGDTSVFDDPDLHDRFDLDQDDDLDGSGTVDFGDILELLSVWGPCGYNSPTPCPYADDLGSISKCLQAYSNDPVRLSNCIEAMILNGTP